MKTKFSIIQYFDPFGDMKSPRQVLNRTNYISNKSMDEVEAIIEVYNDGRYYNAVSVEAATRSNDSLDFDTSKFLTGKARIASFQSIPGC